MKRLWLFLFFMSFFLAPSVVWAQCSSPSAPQGGLNYVSASNEYQLCDGSAWGSLGGGGTASGTDTQIQFNSGGSFGASPDLTWNDTSSFLHVENGLSINTSQERGKLNIGRGFNYNLGSTIAQFFNGYYDSGQTRDEFFGYASNRFAGQLKFDPVAGKFQMSVSNASGNDGGAIAWDDGIVLTSSGYLSINRSTDPTVALDVGGDIHYTGQIVDVSDIRMKYDIKPLDSPIRKLSSLRGFSFKMKGDEKNVIEYGVSAQEVQKVFPELVSVVDPKNGTLGVNYQGLIAPLIEAVKSQQKEIDLLKSQNADIEGSIRNSVYEAQPMRV